MKDFKVIDLLPIKWFGDRREYESSGVRVITVALNPSDLEFRKNDKETCRTSLRFPDYNPEDKSTLEQALNSYFRNNPLGWFKQGFEPILGGMGVSYFSGSRTQRALHTDFCTWYATDPTWSRPTDMKNAKMDLFEQGNKEWLELVDELRPDIMIFSIPGSYVDKLKIDTEVFVSIDKTQSGQARKKPRIIRKGIYKNALCIFGTTVNTPFGDISAEEKNKLGRKIMAEYARLKNKGNNIPVIQK